MDSLKKSNEVVKFITTALPYVQKAIDFANNFAHVEKLNNEQKLELGWYLREAGINWSSIFMLAIAQDYFNSHYTQVDISTATSEFDIIESDIQELLAKYTHFNTLLHSENLNTIHLIKPLLDGT